MKCFVSGLTCQLLCKFVEYSLALEGRENELDH